MLKRDVPSSHDKIRRNLKYVLLHERSQSKKATHHMVLPLLNYGRGKTADNIEMSAYEGKREESAQDGGFLGQ